MEQQSCGALMLFATPLRLCEPPPSSPLLTSDHRRGRGWAPATVSCSGRRASLVRSILHAVVLLQLPKPHWEGGPLRPSSATTTRTCRRALGVACTCMRAVRYHRHSPPRASTSLGTLPSLPPLRSVTILHRTSFLSRRVCFGCSPVRPPDFEEKPAPHTRTRPAQTHGHTRTQALVTHDALPRERVRQGQQVAADVGLHEVVREARWADVP